MTNTNLFSRETIDLDVFCLTYIAYLAHRSPDAEGVKAMLKNKASGYLKTCWDSAVLMF